MKKEKARPLRWRLMVPLVVTFVLLWLGVVAMLFTGAQQEAKSRVARAEQETRNFKRIQHIPSRECKRKVFQRILFIIVGKITAEIYRISSIFQQSIQKLDMRFFPRCPDYRQFLLRRSYNNILRRTFYLYKFIEEYIDSFPFIIYSIRSRHTSDEFRRLFVIWSAIGRTDVGTRI